MKRSIFLPTTLGLFLVACIPQAMAQKQSRLEKLLRCLNDSDTDKWQKSRDKIDNKTQTYYAEELALLDVLNGLWNERNEQTATNYFGRYKKAMKAYLPNICEEEKIQLSNVRNRAEPATISILGAPKDQIPLSKMLIGSIRSSNYPGDSTISQRVWDIRGTVLLEGIPKTSTLSVYQTCITGCPDSKFISQVSTTGNKRLHRIVESNPISVSPKALFDNVNIQKFFTGRDTRPFPPEARALYNDFLFQGTDSLQGEGSAAAVRQVIDEYKQSPYLTSTACTHLNDLEYLSERANFGLLKTAIVNSESLSMLQDFLCTHRYKEFHDQTSALRTPSVLQAIMSTPTSVKYYNGGRLIKSAKDDNTENTSIAYSYDNKGQLTSTLSFTVRNGQPSNEIQTDRLYDPQGHCIFEVQTNPKTRTDLYQRAYRIGTGGSIESDSLKYTDGGIVINPYNKQGSLTKIEEHNKNGKFRTYTANKYDDKGRLISSQYQNLLFTNSSDQIISQESAYECNKYGYLTQIVYQWVLGNNWKASGCLIYLYSKYGNQIDGNSYYECDNMGQRVCQIDREHPKKVERIQYTYK